MKAKTIRLILGDQLNARHRWFNTKNSETLYVIMELGQEADYVLHHRQKILAFFKAMRNFSDALESAGHRIFYLRLDDARNQQSLTKNLLWLLEETGAERIECQQPDEYRLDHQLKSWAGANNIDIKWIDSEHFLTGRNALENYFPDTESYLMETFYRKVRSEHDILMEGNKPVGGRWNFDKENQKKLPKKQKVPEPLVFANDVSDIDNMLSEQNIKTMGNADPKQFIWPVSRKQAQQLLSHFCEFGLPNFGRYQDTMTTASITPEAHWSLFHSRLSFALNTKMLHPLEVVNSAVESWSNNKDTISLAQIEGFVRQIIGWREFVRAIYWKFMPEYKNNNALNHTRALPNYYWNAETKMACMHHSIRQSLDYAYAHHIQRLMVTGNFALLAGVSPDALDEWYLGIYIDAIEWVELPNTRGMSQYADNGLIATKPYISSANYMKKMGHYCSQCHYDPNKKTGDKACPFNSLYWHFINCHKEHFENNHRMGMMYQVWNKKSDDEQNALIKQAEHYLNTINEL
ncbi:cryptochrome/photolyase family protein [Idiomarina sp. X4]|uniref:cryptochrome/photolyase family protein n=1 Tax=Idiomarina sp. X4 TaxID=2055892 RepID=UPI000C291C8F|nr:cryptochrome/photolyase family protein [Idiomarina sp. X4]ATZ73750.1 cryptochrome/photolyase family protein [Idiomarina sp. X4]